MLLDWVSCLSVLSCVWFKNFVCWLKCFIRNLEMAIDSKSMIAKGGWKNNNRGENTAGTNI